MRPIKFKVWDVDKKEWYNNEKIPYQLIDNEGVFCWADDYEWNRYPGEVLIVQYTGLKDKNGVKIYEGDVLSYFGGKYPTVFRKSAFGWIEDGSFYAFAEMAITEMSKAEIIGNIYENPEILGDNQ